jgi:hypothetical protein
MDAQNIHAADEIAAIREEIKQLQDREGYLRDYLLKNPKDREGKQYQAVVIDSKRESIDKASMIAALGQAVVEPFIKRSEVHTLKVVRRNGEV